MKNLLLAAMLLFSLFAASQPGRLNVPNADKGGKVSIDTNMAAKLNVSDTPVFARKKINYRLMQNGAAKTDTVRITDDVVHYYLYNTGNSKAVISAAAIKSGKRITISVGGLDRLLLSVEGDSIQKGNTKYKAGIKTGNFTTYPRYYLSTASSITVGGTIVVNPLYDYSNGYPPTITNDTTYVVSLFAYSPGFGNTDSCADQARSLPPRNVTDTSWVYAAGGYYKPVGAAGSANGKSLYNSDDTLRNLTGNARTVNGNRADFNIGGGTSNLDNVNTLNVYANRGWKFTDSTGSIFRSDTGRVTIQSSKRVHIASLGNVFVQAPKTIVRGALSTRKDTVDYGRYIYGLNTDTLQGVTMYGEAHFPPDDVESNPDSSHYSNSIGLRGDYNSAYMESKDLTTGARSNVSTSVNSVYLSSYKNLPGRTHLGGITTYPGGVDIRGRSVYPSSGYESQIFLDTVSIKIRSMGGASYTDDFSANFGPRSLPDVQWVQQQIAAAGGGGGSQWVNGSSGAIYYNNGNVGIGTTAPSKPLHVVSNETEGTFQIESNHAGSAYVSLGNFLAPNATGDIFYATGKSLTPGQSNLVGYSTEGNAFMAVYGRPTADFNVTGNGRVGMGTAAPAGKVHIYAPTTFDDGLALFLEAGQPGGVVDFRLKNNSTMWQFSHRGSNGGATPNAFSFYYNDGSNWYERMKIDGNGRVGIGTAQPTELLDVNGNAQIQGNLISKGISLTNSSDVNINYSSGGYTWLTGVRSNGNYSIINTNAGYAPILQIEPGAYGNLLYCKEGMLGVAVNNNVTQQLDVGGNIRARGAIFYDNLSTPPAAPTTGCLNYSYNNHYYIICAGGTAKQLD